MAKKEPKPLGKRRRRPAMSPEAREKQLIQKAYDLVEQRLEDGTATSQETVHFLRMGSTRERNEIEKLQRQIDLLTEKTEQIKSQQQIEALYADALSAMTDYKTINKED